MGDYIMAIDGEDISSLSAQEVIQKLGQAKRKAEGLEITFCRLPKRLVMFGGHLRFWDSEIQLIRLLKSLWDARNLNAPKHIHMLEYMSLYMRCKKDHILNKFHKEFEINRGQAYPAKYLPKSAGARLQQDFVQGQVSVVFLFEPFSLLVSHDSLIEQEDLAAATKEFYNLVRDYGEIFNNNA